MSSLDLTDHFLIAMPGMMDPMFSKCLLYICEHHEQGALGVVVNRPIAMNLATLLSELGMAVSNSQAESIPIYFGGPVEMERGFILHEPVGQWQSTISVTQNIGLTTSKDILESLGKEMQPEHVLIALGYSGWAPGQLEYELSQNAWLSTKSSPDVIFETPPEERLPATLKMMGIDWAQLSESAGHG
jgi:putative transcriptional regulator